jgi:membrane-associated phospholipid phosphatase
MSILARRLAVIVSWIGHPLVFVTISVGIVVTTQLASHAAIPLVVALFLSVIAPTGLLLFLGVRSGRWGDVDVSVREERKRFYPIAIPLSAFGTIVMWLANAPRYILRGGVVTLLLLTVAAITNHWSKISLHTLFATYCTMILFRVNIFCGSAALILAALVFWSRLVLSRHTISENIAGVALGAGGGIATAWMSI